ncbi:MBL fold metallo-hydrolase [Leptospira sp. 'Mane']|uniref:MBL fold metallo-hydrolase n=1 Tax=Leptospira sp. 'Mane' TaxID=3387407 RepID=UPI00398BAE51
MKTFQRVQFFPKNIKTYGLNMLNWHVSTLFIIFLCLFIGSCTLLHQSALSDRLIKNEIRKNTEKKEESRWLSDGKLHLITVGTGSPRADEKRMQTSTAIIAGGNFLIFDAGSGASIAAERQHLPMDKINAIFLTHFHSDHIVDVPMMVNQSWRVGRRHHIPVIGPIGTIKIVEGFNQAMSFDTLYRSKNGDGFSSVSFAVAIGKEIESPKENEKALVFEGLNGLKVYGFTVSHSPVEPAFGYRIEFGGKSIVISGDTRKSDNLQYFSQNADILVHEALNKEILRKFLEISKQYPDDPSMKTAALTAERVMDYHSSPIDVAEIAKGANVKTLIYTHITPTLGSFFARTFLTVPMFLHGVSDIYKGEVIIAEDGFHYELPIQ